jgi:hypothetical protein
MKRPLLRSYSWCRNSPSHGNGILGVCFLFVVVWSCCCGRDGVVVLGAEVGSCEFGSSEYKTQGILSPAEAMLQNTFLQSSCKRQPTMAERELYYNPLRTGELNQSELLVDIDTICKSNGQQVSQFSQRYPWKDRFPDMVYTWTVDFHPAPSACNIATYKDIGVILHPEIDHPPFCTFSGFCRNRMNPVFGLGGYMAGFALDPDHTALKRDFYNVYKNDPEFQRIDVFMCSHPLANCELFEPFQKPMIIFATTRYEFGRNDQEIGWRVREIRRWNSWGELVDRQRNLTKFVQKYHKAGLLALTANSKYDAEYMFYFTGIKTEYIPSWCGDADSSYGQRQNWVGCQLPADHKHQPTQNIAVIVPFKRMHTPAAFYEGLQLAEKNYTEVFQKTPPSVKHSADAIRDHSPETYRQYRAVIHIPYQPSTMSFFELYRQNIPILVPSLKLLVEWHSQFNILHGRVYGHPARDVDLIMQYTGLSESYLKSIPDPNAENDIEAHKYWFAFSDFYVMKHVVQFESWSHLLELLSQGHSNSVDLAEISAKMAAQNALDKVEIEKQWDRVFAKMVPNRNRTRYTSHLYS